MSLYEMDEFELAALRPCVGCGFCCSTSVCSVGRNRDLPYWRVPCPYLTFHDGRHWCGVVEKTTGEYRSLVCENLAIGAGCCSGLNSWRREPIVDRRSDPKS